MPSHPLRLNVGFILHEGVGFSREFSFEFERLALADDLTINNLALKVRFSRTPQGLLAEARAEATATANCVRCLDDFEQQLEIQFTELYAFDERSTTDSELIVPEDGYIDLAPLLREFLLLEMPIKPLCKADCAGLCPICGANLNHEQCGHDLEETDPRFAVLGDLLEDDDRPEDQ